MREKKFKIIIASIIILFMISIISIVQPMISSDDDVDALNNTINEYIVDLDKFGIKNNETSPIETTKGINAALKYAKNNGYNKVTMPSGIYLISENESIIMQSNLILDLNGAIFKMNPNGLQNYTMINFTACNNAKLINGTLLGDRYTHDYNTIKGSHEWGCGVIFNDSENSGLDNVIVKEFPGYGISSSLGKNISNLIIGVTKSNLKIGNINELGILNENSGTIRTIQPMNISNVGSEFELGYNKGYMGYPYMQSKTFDSYFYDTNMKFISSAKGCKQYKKVAIPSGAKYVQFVFDQAVVPAKGDTDFNSTTVFLTNYRSPYKISIKNSTIEGNRSLGMALCGGRQFLIEGNTFKKNGGGAPGYAIDMEDGWEYMDGYLFKNNKFIENKNDVVVCAGDNIIFEGNEFSSTVYMYGRATNYKFLNNKFENIKLAINYEYSTPTICSGNIYINSHFDIKNKGLTGKMDMSKEKLINSSINSMSEGEEIRESQIIADGSVSIRLAGVYKNCNIEAKLGDLVSSKMYNCSVDNTIINSQGKSYFENVIIKNSTINSAYNTDSISFNKTKFIDSNISNSTWGKATEILIENSNIEMNTGKKSIVNISAAKMKNLVFKNNSVINNIPSPVLNMYDASYKIPNGNATIENNKIIQNNYKYAFDGVNINSGVFNFKESGNTLNGATMLNPKYTNNQYFKIIK